MQRGGDAAAQRALFIARIVERFGVDHAAVAIERAPEQPNHVVGKGVIKKLRHQYPLSNIVAIDYDPGASEVNQLNRIKLMLSTANKNLAKD